MNPSRPFILRPVATSLIMAGVLLAGAVAFRQLPVSALPEVDYPTIQIATFYPGASPEVTATAITAPLERQFGQMPGLNQMTSSSSDGASLITLQFVLDLDIDVAEQEVQAAINAAGTYLPADLPNPPIYSKTNPADAPILTLALTSTALPLSAVEDLADTRLALRLSQLAGVGLVSISGGQKPAVRIQANPTLLSSYGLTLESLRTAVAASNVNQAKGSFDGAHQAYTIGANDQLLSSSQYGPLVVAYVNGAPVRLSDVATVTDSVENLRQAAWMNDRPAVIVEHPAPAWRQHHCRRGPDQGAPAAARDVAAGFGADDDPDRSHHDDPRLGDRRRARADADRRARRAGHLPLPAHVRGDGDSERGRAALPRRHVRGDVSPRLQPQQPDADGAHHLDGLRRRRRDRDDREHRALHRSRRGASGGGAAGIRAGWLHDSLADGVAHRRPHPAALHGRRRRQAFPRVRGHAERHDPHLGVRLAHPDADDVCASPPAAPGVGARPLPSRGGGGVCRGGRILRPHAPLGVDAPDGDARRGGCDARSYRRARHPRSQGLLSTGGHRPHHRRVRSAAVGVVWHDGRAAAGAGAGHPDRPGGREPVVLHRDRRQ